MIKLIIDGKEITVPRPMTVLDAAMSNGIYIPHFCDSRLLEKFAGCRMCLVEVEKMPRLQTSCTLQASEGMVIHTKTPKAIEARKAIMEFLLINHPLDCPSCDKAGECKLQDYSVEFGVGAGRFEEKKHTEPEGRNDPVIVRNMERCIMCTRCVRMCDGVQGASAISVVGKGKHSYIEPFSKEKFDCEYCGNCITVCPVGALMSKLHRHTYRPWYIDKNIETVCPFCGVGCSLVVQCRENSIVRTKPRIGLGVSDGILCGRGYFGYEFASSKERLKQPMIRVNGKLEPTTMDKALEYAADRLREIKAKHGPSSIAAIASANCTNEDNYALQRLMRECIGSNNIDSSARLSLAGARALLDTTLGPGSTANLMSGLQHAGTIITIGGDPLEQSPVLGVRVRNAHRKGSSVISIGYAKGLKNHTSHRLNVRPSLEGVALESILALMLRANEMPGRDRHIEHAISSMNLSEEFCGDDAIKAAAEALSGKLVSAFVVGNTLAASPRGAKNILLIAALSYLSRARIYLASESPNTNGAIDMGCTPDTLPGGASIKDISAIELIEKKLGYRVPQERGLTLMEFLEPGANIKALYVMGENPLHNLPDASTIERAIKGLELLIVQDIFMTATAQLADVVIPASGWSEKEGTYTNFEQRLQLLGRAVDTDLWEDWRIVAHIANALGANMQYTSAADVFKEISTVSPLYKSLTHDDIKASNDIWPYKGEPPKSPQLFDIVKIAESAGKAAPEIDVIQGRDPFITGSMSARSKTLDLLSTGPLFCVHPALAKRYNIDGQNETELTINGLKLNLRVQTSEDYPDNSITLRDIQKTNGFISLLGYNIEPYLKAPYFITEISLRER